MCDKPFIRVFLADFSRERAVIEKLRMEVFVREQGVPEEMEMDDRDMHCQHFLAQSGTVFVATARLDTALKGKVGRLAVLSSYRRCGVGTQIMGQVHRTARDEGLSEVWCHAQRSAQEFYLKLGYEPFGPAFDEAGIEHIRMRWVLSS
ncbi:GNAT family N-acetyltransferase [Acidithiobacillus sp.]|jgi:predicted GNAT family N-acyltransferase|uniref:GNAT family N-acetyltransferase n=1 Tax=Acidithiobacillus sp. TaxID=1872118 RepID=UPI0025BB806A|nr:GNAT family N-acetyltransferase [Acidithiobacillus sp.]MCK9188465.1 GNAT family N-acetyltransferase [Acidithiobacillus sp.]MCK9358886.1 GNAT family N-acetyltransferase [Acidithiobacillus sp.]